MFLSVDSFANDITAIRKYNIENIDATYESDNCDNNIEGKLNDYNCDNNIEENLNDCNDNVNISKDK
jgi:hypothetical protein